jgi:ribosomal-protein-alanine N-acetyltransferase
VDGAALVDLCRLNLSDLAAIEEIERRSFRAPWPRPIFVGELTKPTSICLGAFVDDTLRGFLIVSKRSDVWDMMNIAVDPDCRRQGIAARLLERLFELTADDDTHRGYSLEVRVSNTVSIALCERFGFETRRLSPGYYPDNGEDALFMWRDAAALRATGTR